MRGERRMQRVKAFYQRKGAEKDRDPLDTDFPYPPCNTTTRTADADDEISFEEIERMAKEATPKGHEFVRVEIKKT